MKKRFHFIAAMLLLVCITASSCQKGEDDPMLSLRSRDARLTGSWQLSSMRSSSFFSDEMTFQDEAYVYSDSYRSSFRNGRLLTFAESSSMFPEDSASSVHVSEASIDVVIREDGSYTYTESYKPLEFESTTWEYDYDVGQYRKVSTREKLDGELDTYVVNGLWYWEDSYHDKAMVHLEGLGTHVLSGLRNEAMSWEYTDGFSLDDADSSVVFSMRSGLSMEMIWVKK